MARVFLTAEWCDLVLLTWTVDAAILAPLIPAGTVLDAWNGRTYVSLVGFRFLDLRVFGVPVPRYSAFEEVNLRYYVRRGDRRGVVFVKEVVSRALVSTLARLLYRENYVTLPTASRIEPGSVRYVFGASAIEVRHDDGPRVPEAGSHEEFIVEHYWGYTATPGATLEYQVEHVPWRVAQAAITELACDFSALYGSRFADLAKRAPDSVLVADGSPVRLFWRRRL